MTIEELQKLLKAARALLGTRKGQLVAAQKAAEAVGDDEEERKKKEAACTLAQVAWDDAHGELVKTQEALSAAIDEAVETNALDALDKKADALTKAVPPTKTGLGEGDGDGDEGDEGDGKPKDPAKPKDALKAALDYRRLFHAFMACQDLDRKQFGDVAMAAMQPQSAVLREKLAEAGGTRVGAVIPQDIWGNMIGQVPVFDVRDLQFVKSLLSGRGMEQILKAIPMLSDDAEGSGGRSVLHWPEYDNVLQSLPPEEPSVYMRVTKRTISGSVLKEPRIVQADGIEDEFGGVVVSRGTEGANANETELELEQITWTTYPLNAYTEASNRLLRLDMVGLEGALTSKFEPALIRRANREIMHGTGDAGSESLGIRQSADVVTVGRAVASQVCRADLTGLKYALRPEIRRQASFCLADTVAEYLENLSIALVPGNTGDQRPLFAATTRDGVWDRLCNFPWFTGTDASALGSVGDVIFGNWLFYWWVWSQEAVMSRSVHYQFKKGLTSLRVDAEAGGKPLHPEAFAVLTSVGS